MQIGAEPVYAGAVLCQHLSQSIYRLLPLWRAGVERPDASPGKLNVQAAAHKQHCRISL
jgi:hypothetical protein